MDTLSDDEYADAVDAQTMEFRAARRDPVEFFKRRENWPKVLYEHAAFSTTFFYGNRAHRTLGGDLKPPGDWSVLNYARLWPLPVGRAALRERVRETRERGTESYHGNPSALADALPFDGMELAGWILDARVGPARVKAFGLVRVETPDPDTENVIPDRMEFRLTGATITADDVQTLCENVGAWWQSLAGQRVRRGRPRGSTDRTRSSVESRLAEYLARSDAPSREGFWEYAGIPKSTWDRYMKKWQTSYGELVKNATRNN